MSISSSIKVTTWENFFLGLQRNLFRRCLRCFPSESSKLLNRLHPSSSYLRSPSSVCAWDIPRRRIIYAFGLQIYSAQISWWSPHFAERIGLLRSVFSLRGAWMPFPSLSDSSSSLCSGVWNDQLPHQVIPVQLVRWLDDKRKWRNNKDLWILVSS